MHRKFERISQRELDDLNKALQITGGNFVAAAKLIDCAPGRAKGMIRNHRCLREKWGNKRRGRPANRINLQITPVQDNAADAASYGLWFAKRLITLLPRGEKQALADWFAKDGHISNG